MTLNQLITTKQQEARKAFWNLEEQEPENYEHFLDAIILSTAQSVLDAVKELAPYDSKFSGENEEATELYEEGFEDYRTELLSRLERFSSNEG